MIKGIKFASVPVTDQDRALEFYTKKLGLRIITDAPFNDDQRWIELGFPRAETKLVLFTPEEHRTLIGGFLNITFVSDERGQMRPATAEEKALAGQQPVLIGASIPVRATTPGQLDENEV